MTLIFKDYTSDQLRKFLRPSDVAKEFGLDKDMLENFRSITNDTGTLRGPLFVKDEGVILYQRNSIITWLKSKMFSPTETTETAKSSDLQKSKTIKVKAVK